jgi:Zn-dependent protease with chaperone function
MNKILRLPRIIYSVLFLLSCLILLSSCTKTVQNPFSSTHTVQSLIASHGKVDSAVEQDYIDALLRRLATPLQIEPLPQITLLAYGTPLAASIADTDIVLSTRLIQDLQSEAELSFVLAHELAHIHLKHAEQVQERDIQELELEADSAGLKIMALAGYDPRSAASALLLLGRAEAHNTSHPELGKRVQKARRTALLLLASHMPVITSSREFRRIQTRLATLTY